MSRSRLRQLAPVAAAAAGCAVCAQPAMAAVAGANKTIVVTANRSDVFLGGFANNAAVSVVRDGVTIATGKNVNIPATAPAEGGVNAAHLAGAGGCWTTFTPQLLPGDTIKVGADSTVVQGVTADPLVIADGQLIVHGTAVDPNGTRLPAAEIDAQLWSPSGKFSAGSSGGQFLSAQRGNLGGIITYDGPRTNQWTARWPMPSSTVDQTFASNSQVVGAWTGPAGAPPTAGGEETDFAVDATPGPVSPCTAPYAPDAATAANHDPVNAATAGADLVVTGRAQPGVTAVTATLTDAAGKALTRTATVAGTTWSATFPGAAVGGLADGALSVTGAYKIAAGTFHGASWSLPKDTVAPDAPAASVPAGAYGSAQSVALSAENGATIRYTTDGSDPTASSPAAKGPLGVAASETLKAVAVDAAGNTSPVASFAYTIARPVAGPVPAARSLLSVEALRVGRRLRLGAAHRHGIHVLLTAPRGAKVVEVRLLRRGRTVSSVLRRVAGNRLITVVLPRTRAGRRHLHRGVYRIEVTPGASTDAMGATTARAVRIR
jgi:hypothetical protein